MSGEDKTHSSHLYFKVKLSLRRAKPLSCKIPPRRSIYLATVIITQSLLKFEIYNPPPEQTNKTTEQVVKWSKLQLNWTSEQRPPQKAHMNHKALQWLRMT